MKKIAAVLTALIISGWTSGMSETKITPVANISIAGGQYYLDGDPSSFGGNASFYFSPVANFSETSALVPMLSINYRHTKDVEELVGGGTLTSQSMDVGTSFKYVHSFGDWKTKARVGWLLELANETEDETWGEGLFDYNRALFGIEAEHEFWKHAFSLALDYYIVKFPNYSSLIYEDDYETSIDTQTYTEISNNAGEDVLDYGDISLTLKAAKKYSERFKTYYSYTLDLRNYNDQTLVDENGSFSSDKRKDTVHTLSAGISYLIRRTAVTLENDTSIYSSNQNSYDAGGAKYIDNYYSYLSTVFSPAVTFYLGKAENPSRLKTWWAIEMRKYSGRLAQYEDGDYKDDKVFQDDNGFGISYAYPLLEDLSVYLQFTRRTASSNNKYEANYMYNYTVSNYFMGFSWVY